MNNQESYLGDAVGKGMGRVVFNAILVVALTMSVVGCGVMVYNRVWLPVSQYMGAG